MKTNLAVVLLTVCGVLAFSAGCGKHEGAATPTGNGTIAPAEAAAAHPQKDDGALRNADAERAAQAAAQKLAAEQTAADKLAQTSAAAAQEAGRVQSLIDTAKNLTGQNKYAEALKVLGELSKLKLTPEQQSLVDSMKQAAEQQAAQAVADKAAASASKTLGDVLGGKK